MTFPEDLEQRFLSFAETCETVAPAGERELLLNGPKAWSIWDREATRKARKGVPVLYALTSINGCYVGSTVDLHTREFAYDNRERNAVSSAAGAVIDGAKHVRRTHVPLSMPPNVGEIALATFGTLLETLLMLAEGENLLNKMRVLFVCAMEAMIIRRFKVRYALLNISNGLERWKTVTFVLGAPSASTVETKTKDDDEFIVVDPRLFAPVTPKVPFPEFILVGNWPKAPVQLTTPIGPVQHLASVTDVVVMLWFLAGFPTLSDSFIGRGLHFVDLSDYAPSVHVNDAPSDRLIRSRFLASGVPHLKSINLDAVKAVFVMTANTRLIFRDVISADPLLATLLPKIVDLPCPHEPLTDTRAKYVATLEGAWEILNHAASSHGLPKRDLRAVVRFCRAFWGHGKPILHPTTTIDDVRRINSAILCSDDIDGGVHLNPSAQAIIDRCLLFVLTPSFVNAHVSAVGSVATDRLGLGACGPYGPPGANTEWMRHKVKQTTTNSS